MGFAFPLYQRIGMRKDISSLLVRMRTSVHQKCRISNGDL